MTFAGSVTVSIAGSCCSAAGTTCAVGACSPCIDIGCSLVLGGLHAALASIGTSISADVSEPCLQTNEYGPLSAESTKLIGRCGINATSPKRAATGGLTTGPNHPPSIISWRLITHATSPCAARAAANKSSAAPGRACNQRKRPSPERLRISLDTSSDRATSLGPTSTCP